jgi:hypothetical protein
MSSNALKHRKTTIGKKTSTQNHVEQHVEASINPTYEQQLFYTSLETMTDHMPYVLISNVISLDPKIFNSTKFQSMTDFVQAKGAKLIQGIVDDGKRFMYTGDDRIVWGPHTDAVTSISNQIKDLVFYYGNQTKKNLHLFTPSLIVSRAGCAAQQ